MIANNFYEDKVLLHPAYQQMIGLLFMWDELSNGDTRWDCYEAFVAACPPWRIAHLYC